MNSSLLPPCPNFKELFKFDHSAIERQVEQEEALYPGLPLEALYTRLEDLYHIQTHPLVTGDWCDLGAGVGVSAILYASMFPGRKAFGIELSLARIQGGMKEQARLQLGNAKLIHDDLLSCHIPKAQTYFLYFPTGHVLDRVLDELMGFDQFLLVAIESHGDLFHRLEQEPNLKLVSSLPLQSQRHHPEARFYQKVDSSKVKEPLFHLSYQKQYLLIAEKEEWWGESFKLEWIGDDQFNLKYPPRSIKSSQVKKIVPQAQLDQELLNLCQLRRLGELKFMTARGVTHAFIRKIAQAQGFSLELSTGDWVEWKEIRSIMWNEHLCYDASSCSFSLPPVHLE